jgi:hypothetical protein
LHEEKTYTSNLEVNMHHAIAVAIVGASLSLVGTSQAGVDTSGLRLVTGQTQPQSSGTMSPEEQARKSQETPSHSQFGGAPKDQETRERQHRQYPESSQHLGPQEDDHGQGSKGASGGGKPRPGHEDKKQDAVSGIQR